MADSIFLTPYEQDKVLEGVIPANKVKRTNWLQSLFGNFAFTSNQTINLDEEFATGNPMGQPAAPRSKPSQIQLGEFATREYRFAYTKEVISSDDFEQVNHRQLGQAFGVVNPMENDLMRFRIKYGLALGAIENLYEKSCASILTTCTNVAESPYFPRMTWDFGRTTATTDAVYLTGEFGAVDLTTLVGNGGTGKRAWGSTGGTKAISPYKDFLKWVSNARNLGKNPTKALMSFDVWDSIQADLIANYKDAATTTILSNARIELQIIPLLENYQDVTFLGSIRVGATPIDCYSYAGQYNDRITRASTKYYPESGYLTLVPDSSMLIKRQGRILNRKAGYEPMEIFLSIKESDRGDIEQEMECSYFFAPLDPNAVITYKVM
jgi:hypothetical protein